MKTRRGVPTDSNTVVTALSISPDAGDHRSIQPIFDDSGWVLYTAGCVASALARLRRHHVGVVLCERDLMPDTWVDMLQHLIALREAPPLIVTSRLADDKLWVEALNLGAYDVLAKPFNRQEFIRAVHSAWLDGQHRQDIPTGRTLKVMTA